MKNTSSDLVIVGGGAAGMMAAGFAARAGATVTVLEKTRYTCRKLGITGKGRCNLTNNASPREVIANIPRNGKFLYSAVTAFPPQKVMELFESLGVPLKTERGNRVFPVSDRAGDIVEALRGFARQNGARVVHARARHILTQDGGIAGVSALDGEGRELIFPAERVLIATGGLSYPVTGSDGDGYRLAAALGHTVVPPRPSLVPLEAEGEDCARMQGFSLKNVGLKVTDGSGKKIYEDFGEMLFTHFGVSGPMVLSASAHMRDFEHTSYTLTIDLKPALDEEALDRRLLRDFEKYKNRDFQNALGDLAGRSMIPVLVERSGIPPETKVNAITYRQRRRLLELFKAFPVKITGARPVEEAIVTSGGVDTREIDPRTMESKLVRGLYFAGEVIDADAYTGGFNLQIAWSTARAAARCVEAQPHP